MSNRTYTVQTSEVAGLINRNPYCTQEQAMLRFMKRMDYNTFKSIIKEIHVREVRLIADDLLRSNKTIKDLYYRAVKEPDNDLLQDRLDDISEAIEDTDYYKTKKEVLQNEMKGRVYIKRGTLYENKGIDQYEKKTNRKVTDRNTEMIEKIVKRFPDHTIMLRAKIDGIDRENNCLIEHKNRVFELFDEIPDYEKVQLEIYMRLTQLDSCKLVQTHFDEVSELDFEHSVENWKEIKGELIQVVEKAHELLQDRTKLKKFMSTYRKYL